MDTRIDFDGKYRVIEFGCGVPGGCTVTDDGTVHPPQTDDMLGRGVLFSIEDYESEILGGTIRRSFVSLDEARKAAMALIETEPEKFSTITKGLLRVESIWNQEHHSKLEIRESIRNTAIFVCALIAMVAVLFFYFSRR